jgi:3-deoxy-D-manno-octulosonic-acid transferase
VEHALSAPRLLYTLALWLILPVLLLRLLWRARRQPAYLEHVAERFGFYRQRIEGPCLWIHAVSVGETRAAEPLIRALRARHPGYRILLTHMTPTGRETGAALFGDTVTQCYLPYDYPGAVARFFGHFQPRLGLLMETELWPNLVACAVAQGLPLCLVNARLSERSARGYQRTGLLARDVLRGLYAVAAQTEADAQRLRALGAQRVTVAGNLKFEVEVPAEELARGAAWRASLGARPVILAASTREGEEAQLLEAWTAAPRGEVLLVIVPRHPQRFDEVAALIDRRGLRQQRRSQALQIGADTEVLLGDSLGEMYFYYAASDVALLGGSFQPHGAQNLIEPCALGRAVVLGPSTYNFAEAAAAAVAAGAALQVPDLARGVETALRLLDEPQRLAACGAAGRAFAMAHQGAAQRILGLLPENI